MSSTSKITRTLQRLTVLLVLVVGVVAGDVAHATDAAPHLISGTAGENLGSAHVVPSSGAMGYEVRFDLPENRGDAQPHLALSYASGASAGAAGWGWSLDLPSIERAPLSGWPKYLDDAPPPHDEDRYAYNGAPLTFICVVGSCPSDAALGPTDIAEVAGYRYYRRQVESGFERFFLSPTRERWVIQRRGGEILELGSPLTRIDLQMSSPYDVDFPSGKIYRWNLAVQRDLHGSKNLVYYQWAAGGSGDSSRKYLRNIFYAPPAADPTSAPLDDFAYHVELRWENPPYFQEDFAFADRRPHYKRLRRVAISAKTWSNGAERELVRAYNLAYYDERTVPAGANQAPLWGRSSLKSVRLEGRCAEPVGETQGYLPDPTGCEMLPATTFEYQPAEINVGVATRTVVPATGDGGPGFASSSILADIDRDGRPDLIEAWPTNYYARFGAGAGAPTIEAEYVGPYGDCTNGDIDYPAQFRIVVGADPTDPRLVCWHDLPGGSHTEQDWFSGRRHSAWLNQGSSAGGGLGLQHNCLDAGSAGVLVNSTLNHFQSSADFGQNNRPPSVFTQFGGQVLGDWGDGLMPWTMAQNAPFAIRRGQAGVDYTSTDVDGSAPRPAAASTRRSCGRSSGRRHGRRRCRRWASPATCTIGTSTSTATATSIS